MIISISKKAKKQLLKIDSRYRIKVISAIGKLPLGDVKKLINNDNKYRLRLGYLRVLFAMDDGFITVYKIEKRGDIY